MFTKHIRVFVYTLGIPSLTAVVAAETSRATEEIRKQKLICGERAYLNPGRLALGGRA